MKRVLLGSSPSFILYLHIAGGVDFQAVTQSLTFTPDQYQMNVSIDITNDNITERSESFTARIIVGEEMSIHDTVTITIDDDDGKNLVKCVCMCVCYELIGTVNMKYE